MYVDLKGRSSSVTVLKKVFVSPPYSLSVEASQSAEIRCLPPQGVPPARIYWLRNNVPIETDSDHSLMVSTEGHLLLGEAKLNHQANYTCVAENIVAKRLSDPVTLTVYGNFTNKIPKLNNNGTKCEGAIKNIFCLICIDVCLPQ